MKLFGWIALAAMTVIGHEGTRSGGALDVDVEACTISDPEEWFALNVNVADLTWESLAEYSPDERRIIDRSVDDRVRGRLRRDHLRRMSQDDRFSIEQRATIDRVRGWYGTTRDPDVARTLVEEVSRQFSRDEAWQAFRLLGPATPNAPLEAESSFWCTCRFSYECPEGSLGRRCLKYVCIPRPGCGPMGGQWCRGRCFTLFAS